VYIRYQISKRIGIHIGDLNIDVQKAIGTTANKPPRNGATPKSKIVGIYLETGPERGAADSSPEPRFADKEESFGGMNGCFM